MCTIKSSMIGHENTDTIADYDKALDVPKNL